MFDEKAIWTHLLEYLIEFSFISWFWLSKIKTRPFDRKFFLKWPSYPRWLQWFSYQNVTWLLFSFPSQLYAFVVSLFCVSLDSTERPTEKRNVCWRIQCEASMMKLLEIVATKCYCWCDSTAATASTRTLASKILCGERWLVERSSIYMATECVKTMFTSM